MMQTFIAVLFAELAVRVPAYRAGSGAYVQARAKGRRAACAVDSPGPYSLAHNSERTAACQSGTRAPPEMKHGWEFILVHGAGEQETTDFDNYAAAVRAFEIARNTYTAGPYRGLLLHWDQGIPRLLREFDNG